MALLRRLGTMTYYISPRKLRAAIGVLSSEERRRWISTFNAPKLSKVAPDHAFPWYSFRAIDYLERSISSGMRVLEYGSGYSTFWWAQRVAEMSSVERSAEWCAEVRAALSSWGLCNVRLVHFDKFPVLKMDKRLETTIPDDLRQLVDEYILSPDPAPASFDVVVVDDVFRNATVARAIDFLKPGGFLLLDDSEREAYAATVDMLTKMHWHSASFFGPGPYHFHEKQTTIWKKPIEYRYAPGQSHQNVT